MTRPATASTRRTTSTATRGRHLARHRDGGVGGDCERRLAARDGAGRGRAPAAKCGAPCSARAHVA
eukprot:6658486-Prymnesium_polylepis.1